MDAPQICQQLMVQQSLQSIQNFEREHEIVAAARVVYWTRLQVTQLTAQFDGENLIV